MQGQLLAGRYRLGDAIGSGGMGRVWRAHDEVLHRVVAIKELTAALYVSESDRAVLLARTRGEARAAARINHPAVVTVHDVLEHDSRPWIVMELVEGRSLADAVDDEGRVEPREAARIGLWVLRALRAAHAAGVLHRDVKPGNVLLSADGRVLLTDFGIAQIEGDSTITRTGEVVGSVDYLAPERVRGHDPGPASDLWALGATLYTAVEGRSPFRRTSPLTTMQAVVEEEAEPPRYAGPLEPVISALLRKDPAARPAADDAEQMLAEAAEGRRSDAAQAYVPTGPVRYGPTEARRPAPTGPTASTVPAASAATAGPAVPAAATGPDPAARAAAADPAPPAAVASALARVRRGHRARTVLLAVALAALAGGGIATALHWPLTDGSTGSASASSTYAGAAAGTGASAGATPSGTGAEGAVPAGWERREDPVGFSILLPEGWERSVSIDQDGIRQVDYSPDDGEHLVRVAIDTAPDFSTSYEHMSYLDERLAERLRDYERLELKAELFRDLPGVRWEYTWNALAQDAPHYTAGPYRAIDVGYMGSDDTEYAVYASAPADDWATTSQQFDVMLRSFQEG